MLNTMFVTKEKSFEAAGNKLDVRCSHSYSQWPDYCSEEYAGGYTAHDKQVSDAGQCKSDSCSPGAQKTRYERQ